MSFLLYYLLVLSITAIYEPRATRGSRFQTSVSSQPCSSSFSFLRSFDLRDAMEPEASTSDISTFYTITRSAYPGHRSPHLLTLTSAFPGDGDARRWPRTHSELKLLDPDDSKAVLWRGKAGDYLAKELGLYGPGEHPFVLRLALLLVRPRTWHHRRMCA